MSKFIIAVLVLLVVTTGFILWQRNNGQWVIKPFGPEGSLGRWSSEQQVQEERPLDKYTIDALSKTQVRASAITLGKVIEARRDSTFYVFYFDVEGKKVSGLANVPKARGEYPVIVMLRGYVDRETYTMGAGTQRAGEVFAKSGFITLAPDFLGYGESDMPSENPIEERFQTHTTVLVLLESIKNLNTTFAENNLAARAASDQIGIWGHSNGGQIALTVLEVTGRSYPTVLWAPVSKPFPYSVLYYTDDFDDRGKMLRRTVADFEKDYDVELYNVTNFFDKINAPLAIHQGTADDSVPQKWSDQLVDELERLGKDVEYFTYAGSDHNLVPGGWNSAVSRAIDFWVLDMGKI